MIETEEERHAFFEGCDPIADHLLLCWSTRLLAGETGNEAHGLADAIIKDFCLRVMLNRAQSQVALYWLAEVLGHGKPDARRAFLCCQAWGLDHRPVA